MRSVPFSTLRCYANCIQGERHHMEDNYVIAYQERKCLPSSCLHLKRTNADATNLEAISNIDFYYFGVFDGHGGRAASEFAMSHLLENIVVQPGFASDDDDKILDAIRKGFRSAHLSMHKHIANWPRTNKDLPSTAGTTASVLFIKNGKYYTGHVGDSRIVLATENRDTGHWISTTLTTDHKPECPREMSRIFSAGGMVSKKNGVDRVVWEKPVLKPAHPSMTASTDSPNQRTNHITNDNGMYRVSHPTNYPIQRQFIRGVVDVPFLAVARSLGDLWSYNDATQQYIVSPDPDVDVRPINPQDRAIILASDGLWNMVNSMESVRLVQELVDPNMDYELFENFSILDKSDVSASLVDYANQQWKNRNLKADNTTALVILLGKNSSAPQNSHCKNVGSEEKVRKSCIYCSCNGGITNIVDESEYRTAPVVISNSERSYRLKNVELSLGQFPNSEQLLEKSDRAIRGLYDPISIINTRKESDDVDLLNESQIELTSMNDGEITQSMVDQQSSEEFEAEKTKKRKKDAQTQANMPAMPPGTLLKTPLIFTRKNSAEALTDATIDLSIANFAKSPDISASWNNSFSGTEIGKSSTFSDSLTKRLPTFPTPALEQLTASSDSTIRQLPTSDVNLHSNSVMNITMTSSNDAKNSESNIEPSNDKNTNDNSNKEKWAIFGLQIQVEKVNVNQIPTIVKTLAQGLEIGGINSLDMIANDDSKEDNSDEETKNKADGSSPEISCDSPDSIKEEQRYNMRRRIFYPGTNDLSDNSFGPQCTSGEDIEKDNLGGGDTENLQFSTTPPSATKRSRNNNSFKISPAKKLNSIVVGTPSPIRETRSKRARLSEENILRVKRPDDMALEHMNSPNSPRLRPRKLTNK